MPSADSDASCLIVRQEVEALLAFLKLPIDDRGRHRAASRAQWFASRDIPLDTDGILTAAGPLAAT